MALLSTVKDGSFSGLRINSIFKGVARGQVLLCEVSRNYDDYQKPKASLYLIIFYIKN